MTSSIAYRANCRYCVYSGISFLSSALCFLVNVSVSTFAHAYYTV